MLTGKFVWAISTFLVAAAAKGPSYELRWHAPTGTTIHYFVHATSSSGGRSIEASANLAAKASKIQDGVVAGLNLSTSKVTIKTSVETDTVDDVKDIGYVAAAGEAPRELGMLANIPVFLFSNLPPKPLSQGQKWSNDLGSTFKIDSISKIGTIPVLKVLLTGDPKRLDIVSGTYWVSVADGSVVRAQIHTKRDPGVDLSHDPIEWSIFVDRIGNAVKK